MKTVFTKNCNYVKHMHLKKGNLKLDKRNYKSDKKYLLYANIRYDKIWVVKGDVDMDYITVGRKYNEGKVALVKCEKDGPLDNITIKDKCFLLIILTKGKLEFKVGAEKIIATAPSFLCFDETENPVLISKSKARYTAVYFHPNFLNVNMTFELLRSKEYGDIATTHDMFLLNPLEG